MIYGIGIDMVSVRRIQDAIDQNPSRFPDRILTRLERLEFNKVKKQGHFLAKRYAAKEALAKAFGTGIGNSVRFHDIEIRHRELGQPYFYLMQNALQLIEQYSLTSHLSVSDEQEYAIAKVILEKRNL